MKCLKSALILLTAVAFLIAGTAKAQTPATATANPQPAPPDSVTQESAPPVSNPFSWSAFVDAYYSYDLNQPDSHERPFFMVSHKRANEFNVNLALLRFAYATPKVRSNVALMAGVYPQYNLAAEQELLRHLYEANVGFKLAKKLWLDAGIFPSHIGAETAITQDNLTLTRSLGADNTPYYEAGAKLTYEASKKLTLTGLVLNGWQNIRENNNAKAFGAQVQYKLSDKVLLNYSNFLGNEKPDSASQLRFFHDVYATANLFKKWDLIAAFDLGTEEKEPGDEDRNGAHTWWNPTLTLKYHLTGKWGIAARGEYYHDRHGIILDTGTTNGFQAAGYSLNLDYAPAETVLWRLEGRLFDSKDEIFTDNDGDAADTNLAFTTAISIKF